MEWQNGRQLSRAATERDSTTEDVLDFAYDANGIRTRKTVTRNTYRPVQTYKVTFVADGKTVKTMSVTEGYTLKDSDYPAVPEKAGYTGAWQRYPSPVQSNVTVSATYTKITTYYTVTFVADGFTVKTMQVYSGYTLKDSDYPSVPEKVGYTGHWNKITAPITKNTFVYAVYYSADPTHIVTFYFAGEDYGTLTVDDGYILQDCDYPELPTRDGYTAYWDTYTQPIRKDITVTGNWEENAIIPPQPTDPPEIMSGDASEPVEAGAEAYASGALVSTETVTHEYLTQSGKIVREVITAPTETTTLDFFYDESGRPFAFNYSVDGSDFETYYYILNLQGDVVQIIDANGVMQAEYIYSPWGEVISAEGDLAEINPLRYRGYYYDSETGFYYLRSRYYDPENHRFINADSKGSTGQGFIGTNMFAYCLNMPVIARDANGRDTEIVIGGWEQTVYNGDYIATFSMTVSVPVQYYNFASFSVGEDGNSFAFTIDDKTIYGSLKTLLRDNYENYTNKEIEKNASFFSSDGTLTLGMNLSGGCEFSRSCVVEDVFTVNLGVSVTNVSFWEKVTSAISKACPGMADGAPTGGGMGMMYSGGGGVYASFGGLNPMMKRICSFL